MKNKTKQNYRNLRSNNIEETINCKSNVTGTIELLASDTFNNPPIKAGSIKVGKQDHTHHSLT